MGEILRGLCYLQFWIYHVISAGTPDFIEIICVYSEEYQLRRSLDLIPLCYRGEKMLYLLCELVTPVCYMWKVFTLVASKMIDRSSICKDVTFFFFLVSLNLYFQSCQSWWISVMGSSVGHGKIKCYYDVLKYWIIVPLGSLIKHSIYTIVVYTTECWHADAFPSPP